MTDHTLKKQVFAATKRQIGTYGSPDWDKAAIVRRFLDHGVARSTLYRWVDEAVAKLRPGAAATRAIEASKSKPDPDKAAATAAGALAAVVLPPRMDGMGGALLSIEALMEEMKTCVANARDVARHARTPEGAVRMSKTLLAASEHNRRCMETLLKIQEAWRSSGEIDRFMDAVIFGIRDVAAQYPEAGKLMLDRIRAVSGRWG